MDALRGKQFTTQKWNDFAEWGRFSVPDAQLRDRVETNIEYYSGNYLIIVGVVFLLTLFTNYTLLFACLVLAALGYGLFFAAYRTYNVGGIVLTKLHQIGIFAAVAMITVYKSSGLTLFYTTLFSLLLVLAHAATRKRSVGAKIHKGVSGVRSDIMKTIKYFMIVLKDMFVASLSFLKRSPKTLFTVSFLLSLLVAISFVPGAHQVYVAEYSEVLSIAAWWVGLGVLSSVGLGTGLHTFVLYLGPHIAKVTLAATEWRSLDFEEYGPNAFINPMAPLDAGVTFWAILSKVQLAALLWGAGTAIGELPPYFVARTARLKGLKLEQEAKAKATPEPEKKKNIIQRMSAAIPALIGNMGFFGILAFASIPNPLFDLAGITCGHFLVPFWKFFGATLIGKAVVKAHIQACFVILAFNMETLTWLIAMIEHYIPMSEGRIQPILEKERQRLNSSTANTNAPKSLLGVAWDCVLASMILYFLISIIDSSVQEHLVDKDTKKIEDLTKLAQSMSKSTNTSSDHADKNSAKKATEKKKTK
eukprot:gene11907-13873_t